MDRPFYALKRKRISAVISCAAAEDSISNIYSVCPANYNKTGTNDRPEMLKYGFIRANTGKLRYFQNLDN